MMATVESSPHCDCRGHHSFLLCSAVKVLFKGSDQCWAGVIYCHHPPQLSSQWRHALVFNATGHNVIEPAQVRVAVDGNAVRCHVPAAVDTWNRQCNAGGSQGAARLGAEWQLSSLQPLCCGCAFSLTCTHPSNRHGRWVWTTKHLLMSICFIVRVLSGALRTTLPQATVIWIDFFRLIVSHRNLDLFYLFFSRLSFVMWTCQMQFVTLFVLYVPLKMFRVLLYLVFYGCVLV